MRCRTRPLVVLAVGAAIPIAQASQAQSYYGITDIPAPPGGNNLYAQAINSNGLVTGYYWGQQGGTKMTDAFVVSANGTSGTSVTVSNVGSIGYNSALGPSDQNFAGPSWGLGINSAGNIAASAGTVAVGPGSPTSSAGFTDLGNLGGPFQSFVSGINKNNVVAGVSGYTDVDGNNYFAPVAEAPDSSGAYSNGLVTLPGATQGGAYGINDSGTVVGFLTNSTGTGSNSAKTGKIAAEWTYSGNNTWVQNTSITDPATQLGKSNGQSIAFSVNAQGDFVGVTEAAHSTHAFLELSNGTVIDLDPAVTGSLTLLNSPFYRLSGGTSGWGGASAGNAYNLLDQTVGAGGPTGVSTTVGAIAVSLTDELPNNTIEIVGDLSNTGQVGTGELWTVNLLDDSVSMTPLNSLVSPSSVGDGLWSFQVPTGINDSGQIVGIGQNNGALESFVLTAPAAVPEPSAGLLALAPALGLLRRRRMR